MPRNHLCGKAIASTTPDPLPKTMWRLQEVSMEAERGLGGFGVVRKTLPDHLFHALLRTAMGPQALLGPHTIELLA